MDVSLLQQLLSDLESARVERTSSLNKSDKFCEAICAFANDIGHSGKPGYLFVGANEDGTATGASITDQLLQNLAAIRSDGNVQPLPVMNVEKIAVGGGDVAVVEVLPSDMPPVRYKGQVWVRVGPRRAIASEAEERILAERRAFTARSWDLRACREASLADLSTEVFATTYRPNAVAPDVIEENHRTIEQQLAALRFFDLKASAPTNAGILMFAKDPLAFAPGAYVQYVRYAGETQSSDVERERRFSGDLLSVMRGLDELTKDIAASRPVTENVIDREVFAYPPRALHELLMNAVIHRSYESNTPVMLNEYSDRIEILNPGGLYGDLTPAQFPRMTAYRNPTIAEAAKTLGFVNRFGRGIDIVQQRLLLNGSRPCEFDIQANHLLAIVRRRA